MKIKNVIKKLTFLAVIASTSLFSQNEFEKYGPLGTKVYVDLNEALLIERGVYKMDLSYKKLDPKIFDKINKLTDLQVLKLSGNEITQFPKKFSELSNLVYFATYNNSFTAFPFDFKKMYNLTHIEFYKTKIDSFPSDIAYLSKLKTIKFGDTEDTLKLPESLKFLKNLQDLQIENCVLDSFPKQLFKIKSLVYFYLANTNTHYLSKHFERLPNLEVLIIENNPIAQIPNTIYLSKKLRFISLRNNKLSKLPDTISQLENLVMLDLRGNPFTKEDIEILKALLPGCEVKF